MAVRVDLISKGVREMLRGEIGKAAARGPAERIKAAAGPGHELVGFQGRNRYRYTVRTTTAEAALAERHHKNLTNAIRAGG